MSIQNVQARVAEIESRIQGLKQSVSDKFQTILGEKLGQNTEQTAQITQTGTAEDQDTLTATGIYYDQTNQQSALTGRYCIKCGTPETAYTGYGATYTGSVDTSDGMLEKASPYMSIITEASQKYGVPVNLIMGVIKAESDFDNNCVSSAGAKGLMQIMPVNAQEFGVTDVFDPRQNIFCGTDEIARHLKTYNGDTKLALAAYNTGPGNIAKRNVTSSSSPEYLTVPQSVRDYADRVLRYAGLSVSI